MRRRGGELRSGAKFSLTALVIIRLDSAPVTCMCRSLWLHVGQKAGPAAKAESRAGQWRKPKAGPESRAGQRRKPKAGQKAGSLKSESRKPKSLERADTQQSLTATPPRMSLRAIANPLPRQRRRRSCIRKSRRRSAVWSWCKKAVNPKRRSKSNCPSKKISHKLPKSTQHTNALTIACLSSNLTNPQSVLHWNPNQLVSCHTSSPSNLFFCNVI